MSTKKTNAIVNAPATVHTGVYALTSEIGGGFVVGNNHIISNDTVVMNEDGTTAYAVITRDKDGAEIERLFVPATPKAKAVLGMINALKVWDGTEDLCKAYLMSEFKNGLWEDMGYRSFAEGAQHQCGIGANSANQYARVGYYFLTGSVSEDGKITADWAESWCGSFKITNLFQCLAIIKSIEDAMEDPTPEKVRKVFYDEYIATDKLHPARTQTTVKAEVRTLTGKAEVRTPTGKAEGKAEVRTLTGKAEEMTVERAIAVLTERVLEVIPSDQCGQYTDFLAKLATVLTTPVEK